MSTQELAPLRQPKATLALPVLPAQTRFQASRASRISPSIAFLLLGAFGAWACSSDGGGGTGGAAAAISAATTSATSATTSATGAGGAGGEAAGGAGGASSTTTSTDATTTSSGPSSASGAGGGSPATCSNGQLDPGEAGIDCGAECSGCQNGAACSAAADCGSGYCDSGTGVCSAWSARYGDAQSQTVAQAVFAPDGDIVLAGAFEGTIDFGGGPLTANARDGFVARLGRDGALRWARRVGGSGDDTLSGVAVDGAGRITIAGTFDSAMLSLEAPCGDLTSSGATDGLVAMLDSDTGACKWVRHIGGMEADDVRGIIANAVFDVFVVGTFRSDLLGFGCLGGTHNHGPGKADMYVIKLFGELGDCKWSTAIGSGDGDEEGVAIGTDGVDAVAMGRFAAPFDAGGGTLTPLGGHDAFVLKLLGGTGAFGWARSLGSTGEDEATALTADATLVYVTGSYGDGGGDGQLGGAPLANAGGPGDTAADTFLAAYTLADGSPAYSFGFGGEGSRTLATGLVLTKDGDLLLSGTFSGASSDLGGGPFVNAVEGTDDAFLARYLAVSGAHVASTAYGGGGDDRIRSVAESTLGDDILLAGHFTTTLDLGASLLTSAGAQDAFVASLGVTR